VSRVAYVNGRYVPHGQAVVHVEDRGFQFADGVYEVWAVLGGRLADAPGHTARLERSLRELDIAAPMSPAALAMVVRETVRRNRVRDGLAYLQITRGTARRDHAFPPPGTPATVVVTAKPLDFAAAEARAEAGVRVITTPETRWARCDIKSVSLLPNVLAKQAAKQAGAAEAWFVDGDGLVTEGSSTSAWIVDAEGVLRTRDLAANILPGVTRNTLIDLARGLQMRVDQTPFSVAEACAAREAFFTAASAFITPVTAIDGRPIGDGRPGPVTRRLRALYVEQARTNAA